jgi:hypothetical protein
MGQSCVCRETFIRGQCYSVLPALSADGIIALDIFEGSVNKEWFVKFVEEQVVSTSGLQTLLSLFNVVCRLRS